MTKRAREHKKENLCQCGCGQLVTNKYARGHCHRVNKEMYTEEWKEKVSKNSKENNPFKGKKHTEETKEKLRLAQLGNKWTAEERATHESRWEKRRLERESKRTLCACGCGELAEYGNKYIKTHHHRNRSDEVRKNMGSARRGKKFSEESKQKLSEYFTNNHPRGMKGKRHSEEAKDKMSLAQANFRGFDVTNWKRKEKKLIDLIRGSSAYKTWRNEVYKRDIYICQDCEKTTGGDLNAHHLVPFIQILFDNNIKSLEEALGCDVLWDVKNGVTLCKECHEKRHKEIEYQYHTLNKLLNSDQHDTTS